MLSVLFKKQLSELISGMLGGKSLKDGIFSLGRLLYLLVGFLVFLLLFRVFYATALTICQPLCQMGQDWLYFALMAVMATFVGVTGSMFTANSTIYQAKDNEILLSLPIPLWMIVAVRIAMIYLVSGAFELAVMIPSILAYQAVGNAPVWALGFQILAAALLPAAAVVVACLLGWITAMINSKIRQQAIFSVITSLAFIGIFYYVYWNLYQYLQLIIQNAEAFGGAMKIALYPFYQMGLACTGSPVGFILFAVLMAALMVLILKLVSMNFLELAMMSKGRSKKKVAAKIGRASSPSMAFFVKEFRRFISSEVSMMSCALGSIMMSVIGVLCFTSGEFIITTFMGMPEGNREGLPLMAMLVVGMMSAMNTVSATSISLEGKHFWMLKVLPIAPWKIFAAKIGVHLAVTLIPSLFLALALAIAGGVGASTLVWMLVTTAVFVLYSAVVGLMCNLKYPYFNWTNEAQAVKKNASVIIATLAPWGLLIIIGISCLAMRLLGDSNDECLKSAASTIAALTAFLMFRLVKKGTNRFYEL